MSGDRREPLWADSLADQPVRTLEGVQPRPQPARPRPRPSAPSAPVWPGAVALGALAAILGVALAMVIAPRADLTLGDLPSGWDEIRMTCDTARLEQDGRAVELFRCRATDGRRLPPGTYRSPSSQWNSDVTRQAARANVIEITPDGDLTGWAVY